MSKYLYIPQDIAWLFQYSDLTLSDERFIRDDLWEKRAEVLAPQYRHNRYKFVKEIYSQIQRDDDIVYSKIQVINKILNEIGSTFQLRESEDDVYYIEAFFRFIKLRLTYVKDCNHVRLKLRTLLREFGYKRRTEKLVSNINRSLRALKLECYLRNYEKCNIGDVNLDDMIMIRLKNQE